MIKKISTIFILIIMQLFSYAEDKNTFGLGLTYLSAPSYIGSKKQNNYLLPFPYIEYYGKYFNVDRDKLYNQIFNSNSFSVEFSASGMLPVKSKDTARNGMPDLNALAEIGPKFIYNLKTKNDMKLDLEVPIRAAFSVGSDFFGYQGYYSNVDLVYKNKLFDEYNFSFTTGVSFSDKEINNYYYEVKSEYSNLNRTEYHSNSGYAGYHNSMSLTKKDKKYWYGIFVKHFNVNNAVFENSPLIEEKNSIYYGAAFSYLF